MGVTSQALSVWTRNCSQWQVDTLRKAVGRALELLQKPRTDQEYLRWFGNDTSNFGVRVAADYANHYIQDSLCDLGSAACKALAQTTATPVMFDCRGSSEFAAHVDSNQKPLRSGTGVVFIGEPFWNLSLQGSIFERPDAASQSGTIIHEITHFWGTGDYSTDVRGALDIATLFPPFYLYAVLNAYNHEFFHEGL